MQSLKHLTTKLIQLEWGRHRSSVFRQRHTRYQGVEVVKLTINGKPREFNLDAPDPAPEPRRSHDDVVRDPALDEELEIPAFLRRQMNPR